MYICNVDHTHTHTHTRVRARPHTHPHLHTHTHTHVVQGATLSRGHRRGGERTVGGEACGVTGLWFILSRRTPRTVSVLARSLSRARALSLALALALSLSLSRWLSLSRARSLSVRERESVCTRVCAAVDAKRALVQGLKP